MTEPIYILKGVCGSTAHGLAHEDSDQDMHGVFSYPTREFHGLTKPRESIVRTDPDESYHELEKFLRLALNCNPQVLELLWLDEYTDLEPVWGERLIGIRDSFLSATKVHHAYLGYADAQYRKLIERGDSFSSSTKGRTFKHAKHIFRLIEQGTRLLEDGTLTVRVQDRDWYFNTLPSMTLEQVKEEFAVRVSAFNDLNPVLPDKPNVPVVDAFLREYRGEHF